VGLCWLDSLYLVFISHRVYSRVTLQILYEVLRIPSSLHFSCMSYMHPRQRSFSLVDVRLVFPDICLVRTGGDGLFARDSPTGSVCFISSASSSCHPHRKRSEIKRYVASTTPLSSCQNSPELQLYVH
jgi:hypothetical protein